MTASKTEGSFPLHVIALELKYLQILAKMDHSDNCYTLFTDPFNIQRCTVTATHKPLILAIRIQLRSCSGGQDLFRRLKKAMTTSTQRVGHSNRDLSTTKRLSL